MVASVRFHMSCVLVPCVLVNLVKDLKLMTPLSGISNIATMLGLILVFYYLIEDDLDVQEDMLYMKNIYDLPVFIGTSLFALEAVGVASTFLLALFDRRVMLHEKLLQFLV